MAEPAFPEAPAIHRNPGKGLTFSTILILLELADPDVAATRLMARHLNDLNKLRRMQERQQVLVAELQHRTCRLTGVIRSMSDKTIRASTELADFRVLSATGWRRFPVTRDCFHGRLVPRQLQFRPVLGS